MSRARPGLRSTVRRLSLHPRVIGLRHRARAWRDDHLDWPLVQLRRAEHQLTHGKANALAMGDSSFLFVSEDDGDKRTLPQMIATDVGGHLEVALLRGGGFDPRLYCEFIRVLSRADARPRVVLLSLCVRSSLSTHVQLNPRFAYDHSRDVMSRLTSARPPLRTLLKRNRPARADKDFENVIVATRWDEPRSMAEFR